MRKKKCFPCGSTKSIQLFFIFICSYDEPTMKFYSYHVFLLLQSNEAPIEYLECV